MGKQGNMEALVLQCLGEGILYMIRPGEYYGDFNRDVRVTVLHQVYLLICQSFSNFKCRCIPYHKRLYSYCLRSSHVKYYIIVLF